MDTLLKINRMNTQPANKSMSLDLRIEQQAKHMSLYCHPTAPSWAKPSNDTPGNCVKRISSQSVVLWPNFESQYLSSNSLDNLLGDAIGTTLLLAAGTVVGFDGDWCVATIALPQRC